MAQETAHGLSPHARIDGVLMSRGSRRVRFRNARALSPQTHRAARYATHRAARCTPLTLPSPLSSLLQSSRLKNVWLVGLSLVTASLMWMGSVMLTQTNAAYLQEAYVNLDEIRSAFDLVGITPQGKTVVFDSDRVVAKIPENTYFVPGETTVMRTAVGNNSYSLGAVVTMAIQGLSGSVAPYLRFSAEITVDGAVTTLFGDPARPENGVAVSDIPTDQESVILESRGSAGLLAPEETWRGPENTRGTIAVYVHLADDPALAAQNSGSATFDILIDAGSR
ncbi:hypothetical protein [Lysinibacter sp. HNR]|uniref:hypothetical protein n=1 Tax=Lysinibacter sp. HNR TaxID=3031408 RepID=UPI002434DF71|nr:hypothetical protein [Lysinibacter sp. HNR]WGD37209.1 hypothetical protein FrondiHNR_12370 [Lysinibacter sp. HNR]